jgi:hypothetical protein
MTVNRGRVRADDQAGISLVEVIMYSALTALVLSVLGGLFYAGFQTQAITSQRDAATGAAQVLANSLQTSVHNASAVSVSAKVVQARVAVGNSGWQCVVWAITADGKLVYKTSSVAITSTDYSTWTVLASGASGRLSGGAAFSGSTTQLNYSVGFTSGGVTVPVAGTVVANAFGSGSPESCW